MTIKYDPRQIESKWQKQWRDDKRYQATDFDDKQKFYISCMFPYPSGAGMHVGHVFEQVIVDVVARFMRANGFNVMNPMGWDAFGLPAENYAIKTGMSPQKVTKKNIDNFILQQNKMALSIDWSREINTTDPSYYKWTQWIFKQFFERGLAYQKAAAQWWCPVDKTVLANEQVEGGRCWRCGSVVEKRTMKQWFFKITEYADELLDELDGLNWPNKIKVAQKNWIGRSSGAEIKFKIEGSDDDVTAFTTRPDTIFGVSFLAIAPENQALIDAVTTDEFRAAVKKYQKTTDQKSEIDRMSNTKEKTGQFTGGYVLHPFNQKKIPIYVADYVLSGYGTGAVMGVPAHDERDYEFAKKYNLDIIPVIKNQAKEEFYAGKGELINSGKFDGLNSEAAFEIITKELEQNKIGQRKVTYKMRDWLISRQRYWGAPIPIVHTEDGRSIALHDSELPLKLPEIKNYTNNSNQTSVLATVDDWVNVWVDTETGKTKNINQEKPEGDNWVKGRRESDTMDGYACSSWYLMRYTDPNNDKQPFAKDKVNYWAPVDMYVGGDHAVAHLLYVRFWTHVFRDMGLTDFSEPVKRLVYHGYINAEDGTKMSKSKGNVVDPVDVVDQGYGADTLRTFELFLGPIDENSNWSASGIAGIYRFINRVWTLTSEYIDSDKQAQLDQKIIKDLVVNRHKTVKRVTESIERLSFNTAIAAIMEWVNFMYKAKEAGFSEDWQDSIATLVQLIAPFAPHIGAELWQNLGNDSQIDFVPWPKYDEKYLRKDSMSIVIQVNGKVRSKIEVENNADKTEIEKMALEDVKIQKFIGNQKPTRVIYVPGRLVNIVI